MSGYKTAPDIMEEGVKTFIERRKVYGSSYVIHGRVMDALFPDGVTLKKPIDFVRFSILNMMIVKLVRYATHWGKPHADSVHDTMVYSAVLEEVDQFANRDYEALENLQEIINQEAGT